MSERRAQIQLAHELPKTRRCALLDVARSTAYYQAEPLDEAGLELMRLIDEIHLRLPFYGSRRIRDELETLGHSVNRKRVQRLMRQMGLRALYPRRRTSQPGKGHKIYPYLLRGMRIDQPNQVWATDVCYIPMAKGFMYLVAVMDWHSRRVLSWRVSNTLEPDFCVEALEEAIAKHGAPKIFNTDQGAQFTCEAFTGVLKEHRDRDQHGRQGALDGQCVRRAAVAQCEVTKTCTCEPTKRRASSELDWLDTFEFYNARRRHSALDRRTPDAVYYAQAAPVLAA